VIAAVVRRRWFRALSELRRTGRPLFAGALPVAMAVIVTSSTVIAQSQASRGATGWAFTYTVTTAAAGRPALGPDMVHDVLIWRGAARISVRSGPLRRLVGDSGVLLVRATDSVISVINPARREVLQAASDDLATMFAGGPPGGLQLDVTDVTSRVRVVGRGEPLAAYATQRHQLDQRYTLQVNANNVQRSIRTEQQVTVDVSAQLDRLDPGFRAFTDRFARSLGQPGAVRRALLAASRTPVRGFPVRTITKALTIAGSDTLRSETRATISAPRREPVDTSTFRIPSDYRVTDMSRLLRPRRQP